MEMLDCFPRVVNFCIRSVKCCQLNEINEISWRNCAGKRIGSNVNDSPAFVLGMSASPIALYIKFSAPNQTRVIHIQRRRWFKENPAPPPHAQYTELAEFFPHPVTLRQPSQYGCRLGGEVMIVLMLTIVADKRIKLGSRYRLQPTHLDIDPGRF